jgi:hypothetical protein
LNNNWQLVGLHVGFGPFDDDGRIRKLNRGVDVRAIIQDLAGRNDAELLRSLRLGG